MLGDGSQRTGALAHSLLQHFPRTEYELPVRTRGGIVHKVVVASVFRNAARTALRVDSSVIWINAAWTQSA